MEGKKRRAPKSKLTDEELLEKPEKPLTVMEMFLMTYEADLSNLKVKVPALEGRLTPKGRILAINSNFWCAAQPGYEHMLKLQAKPSRDLGQRTRKMQGSGASFQSCIEPIIAPEVEQKTSTGDPKYYLAKCFTSSDKRLYGHVQIPGTLSTDASDGKSALAALVAFLNEANIGKDGKKIEIVREAPNMMNYKFQLERRGPRVIINLLKIWEYLKALDAQKIYLATESKAQLAIEKLTKQLEGGVLVIPPLRVVEVKPPSVKLTFRVQVPGIRRVRVNIFQKGKINILGSDSHSTATAIYDYLARIFDSNWERFVVLRPLPDSERRAQPFRLTPLKLPPPVYLSAGEFAQVLAGLGVAPAGAPAPEVARAPEAPRAPALAPATLAPTALAPATPAGAPAPPEVSAEDWFARELGLDMEDLKKTWGEPPAGSRDDADLDELVDGDEPEHEHHAL